jgi:hypothetical protein
MNWLVDATRVAKLVANGNADLAPVFWIRLYGILHDIYGRVSANVAAVELNGLKPPALFQDFLREIRAVASIFSTDERLYIQYRRDVDCHPLQNNYEFGYKRDGGTRETFEHKLLAEKTYVTLEDFRKAVRRVLGTRPDEVALAQAFAERCWSALAGVELQGARLFR